MVRIGYVDSCPHSTRSTINFVADIGDAARKGTVRVSVDGTGLVAGRETGEIALEDISDDPDAGEIDHCNWSRSSRSSISPIVRSRLTSVPSMGETKRIRTEDGRYRTIERCSNGRRISTRSFSRSASNSANAVSWCAWASSRSFIGAIFFVEALLALEALSSDRFERVGLEVVGLRFTQLYAAEYRERFARRGRIGPAERRDGPRAPGLGWKYRLRRRRRVRSWRWRRNTRRITFA